jgi:3-hydroxyisobutyrate dehydrogenase
MVIDDGPFMAAGSKMAMRLANKGFDVVAWNRTASKAEALAAAAAAATSSPPHRGMVSCASTPSGAISFSSVVVLMLADLASIREAVTGSAETMASVQGKTIIQMGTIGGANHPIQAIGLHLSVCTLYMQLPKYLNDLFSVGPNESKALAAEFLAAGASYLEAPVQGSQPEAERGELLIMASRICGS